MPSPGRGSYSSIDHHREWLWKRIASGAPDEVQDDKQHHRPDDGHDEAADVPGEQGLPPGQQAEEKAAQKRPDDADDDVFEVGIIPARLPTMIQERMPRSLSMPISSAGIVCLHVHERWWCAWP